MYVRAPTSPDRAPTRSGQTACSAPAEGFPRDLRRLREHVRAMGDFGRWRLELIEAGIRVAKEGRAPRY